MPWYQEAMKEVEGCLKPRRAANQALTRGFLNGVTHWIEDPVSMSEYIGYGSEPRELKHLSSARKRERM